jgi:hypothetical protein
MTKGSASTNIQRMGAIQLIIFERLATTKRVVHAARTRSPDPTRNALRSYKDCNEKIS